MVLLKLGVLGLGAVLAITFYIKSGEPPKAPQLPNDWWGPGSEKKTDVKVKPFKVNFSQAAIDDLKARLGNTRTLKPALEGTAWTYGVHNDFIPTIVDHWLNKYDFKKREAYINQYPQFITNIQGLNVHFLHVKPKNAEGKRVLPLLLQHGWPGSVMEFYKILPLLTTPRPDHDFVFEVIAPSLPGFGFSDGAAKPGLGSAQIGVVLKNLMLRLGFEKFYTQGGDWGAIVTSGMAAMFPQHVLGMHSNMCTVMTPWTLLKTVLYGYWPSLILPEEDSHLMYPLSEHWSRKLEESGYLHIQSTKPDTLGVSLSDSPAGVAAWILEKFSTGTDPSLRFKVDGGVLDKYPADELLDNVMLYWIPNSMTTAMRIYAESFNKAHMSLKMEEVPIEVPSACAQFPHEISYLPADLLRDRFKNLVRVTKMPRGGHFAAFEQPKLLADDVWAAIGTMEALRKENKGKKVTEN